MRMDRTAIIEQKRELDNYADELAGIHTKLVQYRDHLNAVWIASEKDMMNDAINRLNRQINQVKEELDNLGMDMLRAADDIEAEEIENECEAAKSKSEGRLYGGR